MGRFFWWVCRWVAGGLQARLQGFSHLHFTCIRLYSPVQRVFSGRLTRFGVNKASIPGKLGSSALCHLLRPIQSFSLLCRLAWPLRAFVVEGGASWSSSNTSCRPLIISPSPNSSSSFLALAFLAFARPPMARHVADSGSCAKQYPPHEQIFFSKDRGFLELRQGELLNARAGL